MLVSSQFEKDGAGAESVPGAEAVKEQLQRLLAHPLFMNSKRYPVLLAYTVEQTLRGRADELKERTIGVEAFGREPDYDVMLDPVVRTTAAEVRKRLVQYYYNAEHAGELVVELPVGQYVPRFREAAREEARAAETVEPARSEATLPEVPRRARASAKAGMGLRIALAGVLLLAGFGLGRVRMAKPQTNMERFWEPLTATSSRVTYCLGEPVAQVDRENRTPEGLVEYGSLNVSDVTTLARSIVPLVPRNGSFRVVASSKATYEQLREGPVVLIGAFDNQWTMRVTEKLPIGFEFDHEMRTIVDRKGGPGKQWTLKGQLPDTTLHQDYAIVARIHDEVTGQPVIVLAGIWGEGTEAASEVASNPVYLNALLGRAPKNWDRLNLEAVVETHLVDGHPGPPSVVAVETW